MANKNQAIIDFLIQCDEIKGSSLYFNFINAKDTNKQIITQSNDKSLNRTYIDGSVLKRYTFTVIAFMSVAPNPIPKVEGMMDENVRDLVDVQSVIDWVTQQNDERNFPDFGEECEIEEIQALSENPNLDGIDNNTSPPLAKYSLTIRVEYIDHAKAVWNKNY